MAKPSHSLSRTLHGLFAVYKPPGVHWKRVRDTVETKLLKGAAFEPDLNSSEQPLQQQIRFLPSSTEGENGTETSLTVAQLPVLADHPRVKGPKFIALKVGAGHRLDSRSSGVFVLGVGNGNQQLTHLYNCHLTKEYTVKGSFGTATEDFSDTGRLIEKTTYEIQCVHETQQYLRKVVHEMGLELKSSAVCTHVRRTRDGIFTLDDALIRTHWDLRRIQAAVQGNRPKVEAKLREDSWRHMDISEEDMAAGIKGTVLERGTE
uniref:pseudouridylate synthase TRUB2, mitochondrial isoform X3 n=1 Tax=Pristiophorus japonicus TaxID=55135 RepID=UPI00398F6FA6